MQIAMKCISPIFLTRVVFSSGQGKAAGELVVVVREDGWKKENFKEIFYKTYSPLLLTTPG